MDDPRVPLDFIKNILIAQTLQVHLWCSSSLTSIVSPEGSANVKDKCTVNTPRRAQIRSNRPARWGYDLGGAQRVVFHLIFGVVLLGGTIYYQNIDHVSLALRIRFAAPAFNLVAILIVLVLISRMPTELPNTGSHIHSQGRYRECQVSTSRTRLTSLHASSPSSIPILLPFLNRLLLPTYRKHWQFIRTLLSIFSPPWEHYHQCAHRYHYHIPHPGNDNYQISMERCSIISSGGYDHVLIPTIVELVRSHRSTDNHQHILVHYPVGNNTLVCFWCCRLWFRPWP